MTRAFIALMYQSWTDLDRALSGLDAETATVRNDGGSSIAWTVGHVTNMVDSWLNVRFQGLSAHPVIGQPAFRTGGSGSAEDWLGILAGLGEVQTAARSFLDSQRGERLLCEGSCRRCCSILAAHSPMWVWDGV